MITILRFLLFSFSALYGLAAALRRKAFQNKWLHSETFNVPTICVGNLSMGGTGKTPLVEYIARFLSQNHKIAVLSRGYGRKTKGYIHARETQDINSSIIGDEPMQYATKFPNIEVAVCENRKIGIAHLLSKNSKLEAIVLDDAFQHLAVNYSLKIVLTEYERPFFNDFPVPSGNLREFGSSSKYADIIVVTKCPENITCEDKKRLLQKLKPQNGQEVFFTKIKYAEKKKENNPNILLVTGIANPKPLVHYLEMAYGKINTLHFPDHHAFTNRDIEKIVRAKEKLGGKNCTILTTEKDATRLHGYSNLFEYQTVPIEIVFLENEDVFKEKLLSLLKR